MMDSYRLYFLEPSEHAIGFKEFDCRDDSEALMRAKRFENGEPLELWSHDRFVARIPSNTPLSR